MSTVSAGSGCLEALKEKGFNFFTGVADSTLGSLILDLSKDSPGYVPAPREDLAVGMASGAYLAGQWPCVLMQNSGIGYCLNGLTSLNLIYNIPLLLIVGWRGYEGKDAPEHLVMGAHCKELLEEVGIPVFVPATEDMAETIGKADAAMRASRKPVAVLIRPGVL
jgi:sulfopyruvate decarboxylase alpha subunit